MAAVGPIQHSGCCQDLQCSQCRLAYQNWARAYQNQARAFSRRPSGGAGAERVEGVNHHTFQSSSSV